MSKISKALGWYFRELSGETYAALFAMLVIAIAVIILGNAIKKADPLKEQNKRVFLADWFISKVNGFIENNMGKHFTNLGPYFVFLFLFVPTAFLTGLLGMPTAMGTWSVTLCLGLGTFILIHATAIKYQKWKYFSRFTSPIALFLPINIATTFVPIISLSFRILGNALAGSILVGMVYFATGYISDLLLGLLHLGSFNFIGVFVAPFFHLYFDLFGAYIQTTVFIFLTGIFISQEAEGYLPAED